MFTICLDPGHGGHDSGAKRSGLAEKIVTLEVALAAARVLRGKYRVVLTRDADRSLGLRERPAIAEQARADLFVSIHVNSAENPNARGYEAYVRPGASPVSSALASAILVQFSRRWPDSRNRGLKQANFAVLRQERPACLVECFFISNPMERALLAQAEVRAALGEAIAWGCGNFIRSHVAPEPID